MNVHNWIEIKRSALENNINIFSKLVSNEVKVCAVIKANAYGHGAQEIVEVLHNNQNVDWWAVNSIDEALEIRNLDQKRPILILTDVPYHRYQEVIDQNLSLVVSNLQSIQKINNCSGVMNVHIKVDTGLGRLGVSMGDFSELFQQVVESEQCKLEGIMSHFANAEDVLDQDYAQQQIKKFTEIKSWVGNQISLEHFEEIIFHQAASAATMLLPESHHNMVRIGISLYGLWPSNETKLSVYKNYNNVFDLQSVLTWKSTVIHVKSMKKGEFVGYGCTYQLQRDSRVATIPVGYHEGYNRLFSNRAYVIVNGQKCPVIGRVSMHMTIIDVTDCGNAVQIGDSVILLGKENQIEISAEDLAGLAHTINYEIVTKIHCNNIKKIV